MDEDYPSDDETVAAALVLKYRQTDPQCTKIIYATRTHSQLQQFSAEISKTRFRPRMVTLGSRQQLCINKSVLALGSAMLMRERCNELRDNKSWMKRSKGELKEVNFSWLIMIYNLFFEFSKFFSENFSNFPNFFRKIFPKFQNLFEKFSFFCRKNFRKIKKKSSF
ncbi:unnamed protein product [Gongylonema pulchrum]|uniref:RAD3-like helicase DEAD domain-containing protein n=1 Tax=Gongylonema pulchrum TaxID=637853 RepID=A0A3P7N603_9BILA|nr:unnamed protein product [Gongylonema pulchrum]